MLLMLYSNAPLGPKPSHGSRSSAPSSPGHNVIAGTMKHSDIAPEHAPCPEPTDDGPDSSESVIDGDKYRLLKKLGKGTFGEVFRAKAPGGLLVAVKRLTHTAEHPSSNIEVEALRAIGHLRHRSLLQLHGYWYHRRRLHLAMELAEQDLKNVSDEYRIQDKQSIPQHDLLRYCRQVAEALDHLHANQVVHLDVKPANILLRQGDALLGDFTTARYFPKGIDTLGGRAGTPGYMAPEMSMLVISKQSDQYSLAMTYLALATGFDPCREFKSNETDVLRRATTEKALSRLSGRYSRSAVTRALSDFHQQRFATCGDFVAELSKAIWKDAWMPWIRTGVISCFVGFGLFVLTAVAWKDQQPETGSGEAFPTTISAESVEELDRSGAKVAIRNEGSSVNIVLQRDNEDEIIELKHVPQGQLRLTANIDIAPFLLSTGTITSQHMTVVLGEDAPPTWTNAKRFCEALTDALAPEATIRLPWETEWIHAAESTQLMESTSDIKEEWMLDPFVNGWEYREFAQPPRNGIGRVVRDVSDHRRRYRCHEDEVELGRGFRIVMVRSTATKAQAND